MDPQQRLVLQVGYGAPGGSDVVCSRETKDTPRDALSYADIGVFVGVESSGLSCVSEQSSTFSASGGALSPERTDYKAERSRKVGDAIAAAVQLAPSEAMQYGASGCAHAEAL